MRYTLVTVLLSSTLLLAAGCSEQQLASIDRGIQDVNQVHADASQVLDQLERSPAGPLIPPQTRPIVDLVGMGLLGAIGLWKTIRASGLLKKNQDLTVTLQALVDGVETSGPQAKPVKANIREIMRDREVYSIANPIVDRAKAKGKTRAAGKNC
jgi:hypothetical protein